MDRKNIDSVLRSLRRVNLQGSLFGQTVAIRFGLTESDIEALEVLLDSGSATAGRLSELMGLTTGAVTRVIDRLEQAGYVRRVPDPADRRRVVVEIVTEQAAAVESTLDRVNIKSAAEIGQYSDEELAVINDFLTQGRGDHPRRGDARCASRPIDGDGAGGLECRAARRADRGPAPASDPAPTRSRIRGSRALPELYRATFDGPVPSVRLRDGTVTIQYKGSGLPWDWRKRNVDATLNATIPWDVELTGGANKLDGDSRRSTCGRSR